MTETVARIAAEITAPILLYAIIGATMRVLGYEIVIRRKRRQP